MAGASHDQCNILCYNSPRESISPFENEMIIVIAFYAHYRSLVILTKMFTLFALDHLDQVSKPRGGGLYWLLLAFSPHCKSLPCIYNAPALIIILVSYPSYHLQRLFGDIRDGCCQRPLPSWARYIARLFRLRTPRRRLKLKKLSLAL